MTTTKQPPTAARTHPVHGFAGAATAAVRRVAGVPAWSMSVTEQAETVVELTRLEGMVAELKGRVLVAADTNQVGVATGATSTAAWLANATAMTRRKAHAEVRLAKALDEPLLAVTRKALAAGVVNVDQAWVIVHMVEDLCGDKTLSDKKRIRAQRHLIREAAVRDAKELRKLANRIFEVIAPDEADRRLGEKLEDEERRARQKTRFSLRDNHDGTSEGRFRLPTAQAEMLLKALHAFAAPRRRHRHGTTAGDSAGNASGNHDGTAGIRGRGLAADAGADNGLGFDGRPGAGSAFDAQGSAGSGPDPRGVGLVDPDGRPMPWSVQLGQAFAELIEHLPTAKLPQAGGLNASVLVTTGLEALQSGLGSAVLDTGAVISAGQTRRLCCNAGITPVVLGGDSEPLDIGREGRLHTPAMRKAKIAVDKECTTDGCDRPAAWCEFHHPQSWAEGGPTSAKNARMLCPRHHHYAHDSGYDMRELPNGQVRFHKRT